MNNQAINNPAINNLAVNNPAMNNPAINLAVNNPLSYICNHAIKYITNLLKINFSIY